MFPVSCRTMGAMSPAFSLHLAVFAFLCGAVVLYPSCAAAATAAHGRVGADLFDGHTHLRRATLVAAVLERNPSIEAARQAWQMALQRYPQATAFEDPMVAYSVAPLSLVKGVPFGHEIRVSQRLPFPGKRALAGAVARAEALAAKEGVESARGALALIASGLLDDYYVVERSLEINAEHAILLRDLREIADAQYAAGRASQQDALRAELELALLDEERLSLEAERAVVIAQINGLLHRDLQLKLPPAADPGEPVLPAVNLATLEQIALENRPELRAIGALVRGSEAAVSLTRRQYYPDFGVMSSYSTMWEMQEHRWMAGFEMNVPLQLGRRRAAADEAQARLAQARSEEDHARIELAVEVTRAFERLDESRRRLDLFQERLLPVARDQVAVAEAAFVSSQGQFSSVIDAERALRNVALRFHVARADLHRRAAELDRILGRIPGLPERVEP